MSIFEKMRLRTPRAGTLFRERELTKQLGQLLKIRDERAYIQGLAAEFGITPDHENYELMLEIWREQLRD